MNKNILILLILSGCAFSNTENDDNIIKIKRLKKENEILINEQKRWLEFEQEVKTYSDNIKISVENLQKENFELKSYIQFKLHSTKEYNDRFTTIEK